MQIQKSLKHHWVWPKIIFKKIYKRKAQVMKEIPLSGPASLIFMSTQQGSSWQTREIAQLRAPKNPFSSKN